MKPSESRFLRFVSFTLIALYALILIGGLVRATGSGMGCPDWPKCFGKLVPPTTVEQLPDNYLQQYVAKRKAKNERIANFMAAIGFPEVRNKIVAESAVYQGEEFNAVKTWIEYINRLAGALIGLFVALAFVFSFAIRQSYPGVVAATGLALFLTVVQAFLGSIVVSTNLIPATITMHMLFSLLMVGALVYCLVKVRANQFEGNYNHWSLNKVVWLNLVFGLTQIVLGTQVREDVDVLKANPIETYTLVERLLVISHNLELHRVTSFGVLAATIVLFLKFNSVQSHPIVKFAVRLSVWIVVLSMLTGIILYSYNIPAFAQPIHLTLGTLLTGSHLLLLMVIWHSPKANLSNNQSITPVIS
jgi:cytochrome c oxidase assembly protein subunit 15